MTKIIATIPDKAGTIPDKAGTIRDKLGTIPDKAGIIPDKVGAIPDYYNTNQFQGRYGKIPSPRSKTPELARAFLTEGLVFPRTARETG